ncbi:hypothetical protein RchiOBHm_Chr2g0089821 [Rosa chinensis]|uniref:Uncharacterized protein n=1 Tax=Rosa chinensis TaxID=74649 RepID=A0A2P6RJ99_ROSCH|nr:hypothetical protein RchiOBHm_Chr2g0089821 [Rosa chinensis]
MWWRCETGCTAVEIGMKLDLDVGSRVWLSFGPWASSLLCSLMRANECTTWSICYVLELS